MSITSPTVGKIFAALAKAQAAISNPTKNKINPRFGSAYSTLDEGLNVVRDALTAVEICVLQTTYMQDGLLMLETKLGHSSGEWISSHYPVIGTPFKPQDGLSSMTYARRAALFAVVGIAGEDDDGNAANKSGDIPKPKQNEPQIDEEQQTELFTDMKNDLGKCETLQDLDEWAELYRPQKPLLKKSQQVEVTAWFNELKAEFKKEEDNNG